MLIKNEMKQHQQFSTLEFDFLFVKLWKSYCLNSKKK